MTFEASSSVTLLFDFWHVNSPGGTLYSFSLFLLVDLWNYLLVWWVAQVLCCNYYYFFFSKSNLGLTVLLNRSAQQPVHLVIDIWDQVCGVIWNLFNIQCV